MPDMIYAHTSSNDGNWEPLSIHLKKTSDLCAKYLAPFGQQDTGALLGVLHDLGKADPIFQQVLQGKRQRVNHALAGAALALNSFGERGRLGQTLATVIGCHHGGLQNGVVEMAKRIVAAGGLAKDAEERDVALGDRQRLRDALCWLKQELPDAVRRPNALPSLPVVDAETYGTREAVYAPNLADMLFTRMLFSGLIDADWTATADFDRTDHSFMNTGRVLDAGAALERLKAVRAEKQKNALTQNGTVTSINRLRDDLFDQSLRAGERSPGLYTLTAPTGLGKTLSLMAFALRHCQCHGKRRVIVLLPWLTLLEQNVAEYLRIFPNEGELVEIHSATHEVWDSEEPEDEALRMRMHALSERWDAPCIVTTTVSFFEPLFADKARPCRHLHQIADSVIILDEAQSLPHDLLRATLLCVKDLVDHYNCTVLFSTATQPRFDRLPGMREIWRPDEIVKAPEVLADAVRRVRYDWRVGNDALPPEELIDRMCAEPQALLIVNTRTVAQDIYHELRIRRKKDVFLLSADLCMAHRRDVLSHVCMRLKAGMDCLLVATSCVEAGVDISFPVLLRQLAPLESVIQAAGRCNRSGLSADGHVTLFEFGDEQYDRFPSLHYKVCAKALKALKMEDPSIDCADLALIDRYDARIFRNMKDKPGLSEAVREMDYAAVSRAYQMVENYGIDLIVPYDKEVFSRLRTLADEEGLTPKLIRQARPYVINVPLPLVSDVACPIPIRIRRKEAQSNWYLLGDPDRYDSEDGSGLRRAMLNDSFGLTII